MEQDFDNYNENEWKEDGDWEWAAVAFAAKQPRGNAQWICHVNFMMEDIYDYLAQF